MASRRAFISLSPRQCSLLRYRTPLGNHKAAADRQNLLPASIVADTQNPGWNGQAFRGMASMHHAIAEEVEGARYLTKVTTGEKMKHTFYSDLAYGDGEGDAAPAPMDYAVSSLALCTTMTIRLYAERKGWPLSRIRVEVEEDRSKGAGHIPDGFKLKVHFEGGLSEEQRQRLLEIAGKCPVKQVMLGRMPNGISTELDS